ncbi:MAG: DUF4153 domain-containing protein [Epsilonproteobacteria bacterium]|nr:DUF4153 domain-containing protein [Campylobacterota bacterium]
MINFQMIDKLSQNLIGTLKRFPLASFSAFIFTIIVITLMELEPYQRDSANVIMATKIAFVSSLGIILFPTLRLFWSNFVMSIVGIALLVGYYYILPTDIIHGDSNIFFRHFLLLLAIFLMFIWTPFVNVKISNKNIWEWTQNFILVLVSTLFFSLILYAGISLALYSIERLFNIDISPKRYTQLAILVFGIYGVNLFLSQIPKYIILLQVRTYTKAEEIFTKYILTPLTIGYFLILLAYSAKILFSMQWPSGIVAWISILFSIIAITTYLFWTPLWEKENIKFKRAIWIAILLQTVMLGLSIWMRIEEYGITESRYFVALFGAWLVLMSFYFIFIKEASYKWLFVTLTILLIGSQFGKYSATEVSKQNQIHRLKKIISDDKFINQELDTKDKKSIYSTVKYLYSHHGVDSLNSVTPQIIKKYKDTNSTTYFPDFVAKELGLGDISKWNGVKYRLFFIDGNREIINIDGYKYLIDFHYDKNFDKTYNIDKNLSIKSEAEHLNVIQNGKILASINLNDILKPLNSKYTEYSNSVPPNKMEYIYKDDRLDIKFLVNYMRVADDSNITSMDTNILFRYIE